MTAAPARLDASRVTECAVCNGSCALLALVGGCALLLACKETGGSPRPLSEERVDGDAIHLDANAKDANFDIVACSDSSIDLRFALSVEFSATAEAPSTVRATILPPDTYEEYPNTRQVQVDPSTSAPVEASLTTRDDLVPQESGTACTEGASFTVSLEGVGGSVDFAWQVLFVVPADDGEHELEVAITPTA